MEINQTQKAKEIPNLPRNPRREGVTHTDPQGVTETFASFYRKLYTPLEDDSFDHAFRNTISDKYQHLTTECEEDPGYIPGGQLTTAEITSAINTGTLKLRKAPGDDSVTNEHIIHGGASLIACILKLFNATVQYNYIPRCWKRGLIVPLHKGGNKSKDSCNNYRPIALLPCLFKLFEKVVYNRINQQLLQTKDFPHSQQQGFQKELGCLTASFNLQETIIHNLKQGSNVFVCFLDTSKAFDTVWRPGLMFKLYELGIKGKLWSLINKCHQNTLSSIVVNQTRSEWFPVQQGVRQGGVLSTFLYLVYINDLIHAIQSGSPNTGILNIPSSCTSLADDLALIGISPLALQTLLNIAYNYSCKWRFTFNASKSCVLQFRAKKAKLDNTNWHLGPAKVSCEQSYNHLGIVINHKCKLWDRINEACNKGQKSYFALSDLGTPFLNPNTLSHLYKKIVLPSVLYGCELWCNLSLTDKNKLNAFQHFVCKNSLDLPKLCRSDMCESFFDVLPINAEIDVRKLLFFGRLCRLDPKTLTKRIFLTRLFSYLHDLSVNQFGFIPDIKVLQSYNLTVYLWDFLKDGTFPEKPCWKKIVRNNVTNSHLSQRKARMSHDPDFLVFTEIFRESKPSSIWNIPENYSEIKLCKFICKLCTSVSFNGNPYSCILCGKSFVDVFQHSSCVCPATVVIRENWWNIITNCFNIELCAELCGLSENDLFHVLLGRRTNHESDNKSFHILNFNLVRATAAAYFRSITVATSATT